MGVKQSKILVLDGHDGAGKTTLAARLAEVLGGVHVRPYSGIVGSLFMWSVKRQNLHFASQLALNASNYTVSIQDASLVICDRHWMTAFSVLPQHLWEEWQPLPPTTLCWTNFETTVSRLDKRASSGDDAYDHQYFISIYRDLGEQFGCHILRTDLLSPEEAFEELLNWAQGFF